jgi:hypothetical protein
MGRGGRERTTSQKMLVEEGERGSFQTIYCPRFLRLVESLTSVYILGRQSGTHPFKTLVETITGSSTGGLDVPCSLTERVETEFVGDLGGVHGVGQILSCQHGTGVGRCG